MATLPLSSSPSSRLFSVRLPTSFRLTNQRVLRITIHVAAWLALASLPLVFFTPPRGFNPLRMLGPMLMLAGMFYLNYWVLIPRLLARRRFVAYFAVLSLCVLVMSIPGLLRHFGIVTFERPPGPEPPVKPALIYWLVIGLFWLISSGMRITGEWLKSEQIRKQMHSDRVAAELAFLKSQVNPHFLFNTLNNVYSLAELKSDDAPAAILKLSHLMRYMLYEANALRVPLAREVEYLRNYVELQRLRLNPDQVEIGFAVQGDLNGHLIEPMLLIPFIENAFKHGISYQHSSYIKARLVVTDTYLQLEVRNRKFEHQPAAAAAENEPGGVGLDNVVQRLQRLYPDRYDLVLDHTLNEFIATLTLTFQDDPVPVG